MRAKKIIVLVANDRDACAYYRALSPFGRMSDPKSRNRYDIDFTYYVGTAPNYAEIRQADAMFFLRPTTPAQAGLVETAHRFGTPVWIDWDDDVFNVPRDNPMYEDYNKEPHIRAIEQALRLANVVTVTTDVLAGVMAKKTKAHVEVVKNALDPSLLSLRDIRPKGRTEMVVMWRGSRTHERDIREHTDAIVSVAKANPAAMFMFIGYDPWWITEQLSNAVWTPMISPVWQYMGVGRTLGPDVMMVPLADNPFNQAKSEIAAVEGALFGAVCVAPKRWGISGAPFAYSTPAEFHAALENAMMISKQHRQRESARQFDHVETHFNLDAANYQRADIIHRLLA